MPEVTDISAMSSPSEETDIALLSNGALCKLLDEAEMEEQRLSERRRQLHAAIGACPRIGEGAPEDDFRVAALSRQERELSASRLELHQRILDLRLEKSRRVVSVRTPLKAIDSTGA